MGKVALSERQRLDAAVTIQAFELASGRGWYVQDVVCTAGPQDRPFEESHATTAIALVAEGTFQYRSARGTALMAPGALMLGNHSTCFECGHDHASGDRCISFHYQPAFWEELVASVPGARNATFQMPRLPPVQSLAPVATAIREARVLGRSALEATALELAAFVLGVASEPGAPPRVAKLRDEKRVTDAVRMIDASISEIDSDALSVAALASSVDMSPFHFLRTFRQLVGVPPHQYIIGQRMHRATARLLSTEDTISDIAYDVGFGDLSTFNRQFRRLFGTTPRRYRKHPRSQFLRQIIIR